MRAYLSGQMKDDMQEGGWVCAGGREAVHVLGEIDGDTRVFKVAGQFDDTACLYAPFLRVPCLHALVQRGHIQNQLHSVKVQV